jgi:GNAT superfamily N-acetyltransferase/rRNA-processing protein FCF1
MGEFNILIDTNVVIGLEDAQPVQASLSELVRVSSEHSVGLFVDAAVYDDVNRDRDVTRRKITISKLAKFQKLRGIPVGSDRELAARFGSIANDNDRSDARLLAAIDAHAVDFLVTQDNGLHRRAARIGLDAHVLTIEEALEWLRQTFQEKPVALPYVVEQKAYQINQQDAIFESLRKDYPGFNLWFDKCRKQHRDCWVLQIADQIAGLVIRKDESHVDAGTQHPGPKILKVCTLKVRDEFRGEKFGELLLKQILWFAQRNSYDLVYLTAYPKHAFLIDLLTYYGFQETKKQANGESVLEKIMLKGSFPAFAGDVFDADRIYYPRFYDGNSIRKFCVPIQADYHRRLFPEIAVGADLPLFPKEEFGLILAHGEERTPGNTIRKVYLCRAKTTHLLPGALVFFYMSKDPSYAASQTITTVGVVEQVINVENSDDLIRLTAKRSVFSADKLRGMNPSASTPVKMIDFLLIGHLEPPIKLDALVRTGVFVNRPPQSISEIPEERYLRLRPQLHLGFHF